MTAAEKTTNRAIVIDSPSRLPSFASFAVSQPSEPVPVVAPGEEHLLTDAMVPARREAFARGRAAAHAALRSLRLDHGPILTGPSREPLWPKGATGAISHAAGFGVALVAPTADTDGVGIDLEQLCLTPALWDQVPRPEERIWLERLKPAERETALVALFSAKESVFKAFFPRLGFFFGFDKATLSPTATGFVGRLSDGLDREYPSQRTFKVTSHWYGDIVLTAVVLPKTTGPHRAVNHSPGPSRNTGEQIGGCK